MIGIRRNAHNAQRVKTIGRIDMSQKNATIDAKNDAKNVVDTSKKTFRLTTLCREMNKNEKIVRSRFRRYATHDDDKYNVVETSRLKNAKTRWIYPIAMLSQIRDLIALDDDE
jgi:uncharacterized protein YchJ